MLNSVIICNLVVLSMLGCMLYAVRTDEGGQFRPEPGSNFGLFYIKFPSCLALHIAL